MVMTPVAGKLRNTSSLALVLLLTIAGLVAVSRFNYLLFHALIELLSIVVGVSIFVLAWNSRRYLENQFFTLLGIALLFASGLDLLHIAVYKGMGILPGYGPNLATQLWIAARYLHCFSIVIAVMVIRRPVSTSLLFWGYGVTTVLLLWSIFAGLFPVCFVEGTGLTPFKKYSEILICSTFGIGLLMLHRHRDQFSRWVYGMLVASLLTAISAELAFIFYVNVYGLSNMVGHLFKLISFLCLYLGIIRSGLEDPLEVVFHEIKVKDEQLVALNARLVNTNEELETRVAARTEELRLMVDNLHEQARQLEEEIAERQQAQEELKRAKEAAEAANHAKSAFLANMSHELRTPLNGVVGMAQLLALTNVDTEQKEYLDTLQYSADNLLQLISDILDITKIEADQYELHSSEFSVRECLDQAVGMLQRRIDEKGLNVIVNISDAVPETMIGDHVRVMQIMTNLLSNAVKFTEKGSITIAASIKEQHDSTMLLELTVSDTGIGIEPDYLGHIFDTFTQVDDSPTRKYGGAGLGLAISRKLAELMGGSISVESRLQQGSSFHFLLPCSVPSRPNRPHAALEDRVVPRFAEVPAICSLPVLVAEDNPANLKYAKKLLEILGCKVTEAVDGKEALEAWEQGDFKLILMDIQMPVLRGDEVVKIIREREQDSHVPIIAVTAHALMGDQERFAAAGCDGYLAKPFQINALTDAIKRVMH